MTLYASDTRSKAPKSNQTAAPAPDTVRLTYARAAGAYTVLTFLVALFGGIYEHFGFGVYSPFMIYAFLVPLVLGAIPSAFLSSRRNPPVIRDTGRRLWHNAIAMYTLGSLFTGVVQIYGTTSAWSYVYVIIGIIFTVLAFIKRR